jgi:flagellar protein FlbT
MVCDLLDRALKSAENDQCYQALKLARRVMRHEEVVLGLSPVAGVAISEETT